MCSWLTVRLRRERYAEWGSAWQDLGHSLRTPWPLMVRGGLEHAFVPGQQQLNLWDIPA